MEVRFNHLHFLEASSEYQESRLVIFGCPFDGTASYLPGSRFAPNAIREASQAIESFSPEQKKDLARLSFCDLGDLELPFGNTERVLDLIKRAVSHILQDKKIPIVLGGEHLITLPIITSFKRFHSDFMVIHIDAHADLREEYLGEKLSHATVMRRVVELIGKDRLIQIGIRSGTKEEFDFARQIGGQFSINEQDLSLVQEKVKGKKIYLSLDLDILDPSVLPGTGTPEPGGLEFQQLIQVLSSLKETKVVGMDMVELLPYQIPHQISSSVAAKILRESLLMYFPCLI